MSFLHCATGDLLPQIVTMDEKKNNVVAMGWVGGDLFV